MTVITRIKHHLRRGSQSLEKAQLALDEDKEVSQHIDVVLDSVDDLLKEVGER
jgi:hypothetical protein